MSLMQAKFIGKDHKILWMESFQFLRVLSSQKILGKED